MAKPNAGGDLRRAELAQRATMLQTNEAQELVLGATMAPRGSVARLPEVAELPLMIDQYEIIRELGRGGMGKVMLARDTRLARLVALKLIETKSPEAAQAFVEEAKVTARCRHDNIVVIYSVGEWQGQPYMAMEYFEGRPLAAMIERRPLEVIEALDILIAVCKALVAAHAQNIVHCDLKPENIFVTTDGVVKVIDFGIAQFVDRTRGPSDTVAGTMPYMSFEQWGLGTVDAQSDIWAMGIILWELTTREHPLGEVSMAAITQAIANLDTPLPSLATAGARLPARTGAWPSSRRHACRMR